MSGHLFTLHPSLGPQQGDLRHFEHQRKNNGGLKPPLLSQESKNAKQHGFEKSASFGDEKKAKIDCSIPLMTDERK